MKKPLLFILILGAACSIAAGTKLKPRNVNAGEWVLTKNLSRQEFLSKDTLRFFNNAKDQAGTGNPGNHPVMSFDQKKKEFNVSVKDANGIYGKYVLNKKSRELLLTFYEPDPMKTGTTDITQWNKTGENNYNIAVCSKDTLMLVRKR